MSFDPLRYAYTPVTLPFTRSVFPYSYYWHGRYDCDYPIIDERRAGYCPRINLRPALPPLVKKYRAPDTCFAFENSHIPCHRNLLGSHNRSRFRVVEDPHDPGTFLFNVARPANVDDIDDDDQDA